MPTRSWTSTTTRRPRRRTRRPIPNLSLTPGPKPTTGFGPFCLRVIPLPASVKIHPTRRPPWRGPMMIDRVVRFLLPRQDLFFTLLEQIAAKMTAAATVFMELTTASGHEQLTAIAARLKVIETEADALCHDLYEELDKTFVTPIDREDLAHLTKALDDVIDAIEHAAAFAALFRFHTLPEPMRQMVRITTQAAGELGRAVQNLRKFSDADTIRVATVAVHTLENEA